MTDQSDACFLFNGTYVDIVQSNDGTWSVYYDPFENGTGYNVWGLGSRREAFQWFRRNIYSKGGAIERWKTQAD